MSYRVSRGGGLEGELGASYRGVTGGEFQGEWGEFQGESGGELQGKWGGRQSGFVGRVTRMLEVSYSKM